jgi:glycosyltransferase involved in cell wall biosynthesis
LYRQSVATLLPGVEDFGMVPVEAQACGCPVVALGDGGGAETVLDGETGLLVRDSSVEAFADGLSRVRTVAFDQAVLRQFKERYNLLAFDAEEAIEEVVDGITRLGVIEQGLGRHARSRKYGGATQDVRRDGDRRLHVERLQRPMPRCKCEA